MIRAAGKPSPTQVGIPYALAALLVLTLVGCAAPPTTGVVLLPQDNGSPSALRVTSAGQTQKLAQPYARATAVQGSAIGVDMTTAEAVEKAYPEVFALRPPKPQRFVIYFAAGATELTPQAQQTLREALALAQSRPGADIVLTGHSDTVGEAAKNDQLSLQRAQQIRALLLQGDLFKQYPLAAERIEATGRGERELAIPTPDNVAEPRNRRVEILVR
ncbi:OmpA family protein [Variovorax sp. HJSM1_2]|uniref:OmpA family protein n=1 Tax=Variovorax sp. HJSM1_2 TaxID=3366263 RepID=UPI003BBBB54D